MADMVCVRPLVFESCCSSVASKWLVKFHSRDEPSPESREAVLRHKPGGGNRNGDVADKLFIAEETVKVYNRDIL